MRPLRSPAKINSKNRANFPFLFTDIFQGGGWEAHKKVYNCYEVIISF